MQKSMMQVFVKDSAAAVELYKKAFDATVLCAYPDGQGGYAHAELDIGGQVLAVSEGVGAAVTGNTMMFCLQYGAGGEQRVRAAYEALRPGARSSTPPGRCDYSPCQFVLTDRFGVWWCVFV